MKEMEIKLEEKVHSNLEKMKIKLEKAVLNDVKLYFITRNKKLDSIKYDVLKTEITEKIGGEFIAIGLDQIKKLLEIEDLKIVEYGPLLSLEQNNIQIINKDYVNFLNSILEYIKRQDLDPFTMKEIDKIWAYAVSIYDSQIILFRKYNKNKILSRKPLTAMIYKDGKFDKLEESILTIDSNIDCIYFDEQLYILQPTEFESIFSFVDDFAKRVETDIGILKNIIKDTDNLWNLCQTDPRKIKKIYKILNSNNLNLSKIKKSKIKKLNNDFGLKLTFDSNSNTIIDIDKKNIWTILKVLDDDYLNSAATKNKYEAQSKIKK